MITGICLAQWKSARKFITDLLWSFYSFQFRLLSVSGQSIREVTVYRMEEHFQSSSFQEVLIKYTFVLVPSQIEGQPNKRYLCLSTPNNHTLYISGRNHSQFIHRHIKNLLSIEDVKFFPTLFPPEIPDQ